MTRTRRVAGAALAALAAAAHTAASPTFTTALTGLGGTPIGLTPIGQAGSTTMDVNWLTATDPLVRSGAKSARCEERAARASHMRAAAAYRSRTRSWPRRR
jgi:hypothetical protein